ncbi:hypothetical protein CLV51_1011007 [Chitinophaga niastensis]|uniref:Uncharacterized protein n=1 Tax=Chitinophaga niastensis TaxID=536980 RepID=A0A2P8HTZ2_CHINA|nr:hypothetical protein [Chitinophaga niastensis]PSL49672.1 hypothetical protein CLV51_1011007 [Chitinophaga niastensis]
MRMKLLMVAVIAASGIGLASCNKKDSAKPAGTFSLKVDSISYNSNATTASFTDTVVVGKKTLIVDGVTNNFSYHLQLMITFPDSIHTGSFDQQVNLSLMNVQQLKGTGFLSKYIKVNITSINSKYAEGTFSGQLTDGVIEKPLTDGTFKVDIN